MKWMRKPLAKRWRRKRISLRELRPIVEDYQRAFPEWRLNGNEALVRESGPVVQEIWFERLSLGDYRPNSYVRILVAPDASGLHHIPNLRVFIDNHGARFDDAVKAIHAEFVPSVDKPLDPRNVLSILMSDEPHTSRDACGIAALAAYLGEDGIARDWCQRFYEIISDRERLPDWMKRQKEFIGWLGDLLEKGNAKDELSKVMAEERQRLSLA